jgi:hypothetical protein
MLEEAGRSQMTRAWIQELVDPESADAISAGSAPAAKVHPEASGDMRACCAGGVPAGSAAMP